MATLINEELSEQFDVKQAAHDSGLMSHTSLEELALAHMLLERRVSVLEREVGALREAPP